MSHARFASLPTTGDARSSAATRPSSGIPMTRTRRVSLSHSAGLHELLTQRRVIDFGRRKTSGCRREM